MRRCNRQRFLETITGRLVGGLSIIEIQSARQGWPFQTVWYRRDGEDIEIYATHAAVAAFLAKDNE